MQKTIGMSWQVVQQIHGWFFHQSCGWWHWWYLWSSYDESPCLVHVMRYWGLEDHLQISCKKTVEICCTLELTSERAVFFTKQHYVSPCVANCWTVDVIWFHQDMFQTTASTAKKEIPSKFVRKLFHAIAMQNKYVHMYRYIYISLQIIALENGWTSWFVVIWFSAKGALVGALNSISQHETNMSTWNSLGTRVPCLCSVIKYAPLCVPCFWFPEWCVCVCAVFFS